jgi:hypothetical protein
VNRCAARGCGRWTRAGEMFCGRHGQEVDAFSDDDGGGRLATFRARLAAGDYDALLGPGLREILRGAAADPGLDAEIGALRLALARLLEEERDASRLASGVARVAGVAVQAARLRQGSGVEAEGMQAALRRVVAEIDAETEQRKRAEGKEVMPRGTV